MLTVDIPWSATTVATFGILRPYYSLWSLRGWALVPPAQHGSTAVAPTELHFDTMRARTVQAGDEEFVRLVYRNAEDSLRFTLQWSPASSGLSAAPRRVRAERYLYAGARRTARIAKGRIVEAG